MTLRRWMQIMGRVMPAGLGAALVGAVAFDRWVARPHLAQVDRMLAGASPSERRPPAALTEMLARAHQDGLASSVARQAVLSGDVEHQGRLRRQVIELGVAWLLPLHFSQGDIETAYLASTYMGPGPRGFAAASQRYLGVSLASVDAEQAARLVAIAWAPGLYLGSPERLERRVQRLLALAPVSGH